MNTPDEQRSGRVGLWLGIVLILGATATGLALSSTVVQAAEPWVVTSLFDDGNPGTLRWAINQANDQSGSDTIAFAPEVSGTIVLTSALPVLTDTLTIEGPGASALAVSPAYYCQFRVFDIDSAAVTITGVTVRDGLNFSQDGTLQYGAGIRSEGTLVLKDTDLVNNGYTLYPGMDPLYGGGLYVGGSATLIGGHISGNAALAGGGVYVSSSGGVTISGTQISSNRAGAYRGGGCGGGLCSSGDTRVSGSQISDNRSSSGGGLCIVGGHVTISEAQISGNHAGANLWGGDGGGLLISGGSVTISGGQISNNVAAGLSLVPPPPDATLGPGVGGGVEITAGSATLTGVQLLSNSARSAGGAVFKSETAFITVTHGCIAANSKTSVYSHGGPVLDASYNWWNSPSGPWGIGPGWGDSVSGNVDYSHFTTEPGTCPTIPVDLSVLYFPLIYKK